MPLSFFNGLVTTPTGHESVTVSELHFPSATHFITSGFGTRPPSLRPNSRSFFSASKQSSLIHPSPPHVLIVSGSLSSLSTIADPYSTNPIVTRILTLLSALQEIIHSVNFVSVPSHEGIQGNAQVDFASKSATGNVSVNSIQVSTYSFPCLTP